MKKIIQSGKKLITLFSVLSILAVSVFSALVGVDFTAVAETTPTVESSKIWGGYHSNINATQFEGEGTAVNPYIITNGDQLYKMVSTSGKKDGEPAYYKLADDIYLNDISDYDKWGTDDFDMSTLNNWNQDSSKLSTNLKFAGTFDGDGHYIYGLYSEGALYAAFLPKVEGSAVIKNVHFRNSYCVNIKLQPEVDRNNLTTEELNALGDKEGFNNKAGVTSGHRSWNDANYGTASVIVNYVEGAPLSINNCSVRYAYVKASAFASAIIGVSLSSGSYPTVKNCLVADVTLKTTCKEEHVEGVEGAIINTPQGTADSAMIDGVISAGVQVYGADDRDSAWCGYKIPTAASVYAFKDVYSDVDHTYTIDHGTYGKLTYEDPEIKVVKANYLKGYKAKEMLNLDWEHNWIVVDGDYPMPAKQYNVPTGDDYYAAGGPAAEEDFWDGTTAKNFAAGTGTVEDPYLIENCEQFYLMVSTLKADKNYKIADGVTALYFNNVKGLTYSEAMNVLKSKKMHVYAPGETNEFKGYFDGNGVTIYGIKAEGARRAGIIPQAGSATLKNFTVKNSKFYANDLFPLENTQTVGAAAIAGDLAVGASLCIRNVDVIDCTVNSIKAAAGLVACSNINGSVFVDDCIVAGGSITSDQGSVQHAAFVATSMSGSHQIKNSIAYGTHPAADNVLSYSSIFKNVYTDAEAPSPMVEEATSTGVKMVETDALMGDAVKSTASEFDWESTWKATDGIPEILNHVSTLGNNGEAWSGEISDVYAGGNGSKNNPYRIDTAEKLAQMLNYRRAGAYYTLTADIYLNDVTVDNWTQNAKQWYTSKNVNNFAGIFDGNGYTVYGLYNKDVESGVYAGLIPVLASGAELRNVKVDNAYLSGKSGAYIGAVVGTIEDNASNIVSVRAANVGENVTIEGAANAGGIIGRVGFTKLRLDNSIFAGKLLATGTTGGIVGEVVGKIDAKQSVSVGIAPFASADNVVAKAIYTDVDSDIDGVITVKNSEMIGSNATDKLDELPFGDVWSATAKYPAPIHKVQSFDGVQGEVWSGEIASKFAGGNGTKLSPYLIATPEQLALLINSNTYEGKHFKLIADIYLNDVSDELWQAKVGCNSWYNAADFYHAFTSHIDGDGHVVFGMYYNFKTTPQNSYLGLFPRLGGNSTIKNIGVSEAYIKASTTDNSVYAGGIFGMGSAFYDFYNQKIEYNATVGDEFLVPGESKPRKLPLISNCFVDHTCYINATSAAGIGCPGGAAIAVRDCIVTATVISDGTASREGGIVGPYWADATRVYNSVSFTQNGTHGIGGSQTWARDAGQSTIYLENVYYYGSHQTLGTTRVKRPQWRVGEEAKTAMPELDWENTWRTEEGGTPVLRIFDKEDRSASLFSDKQYDIGTVKVNFITGDSSIALEPMVGVPYEKIEFPTISREGYTFTGWYAFPDCSLLYPYEFFLSRDINVYAGWKKNGVFQDFESYTYSLYDCDLDRWNYNKPGSRVGYNFKYVHTGTKSMQLLDNSANSADLLINYEDWLTVGQEYTISFWVATDKPGNVTTLSLVQNNHPDYLDTEVSVDPMVTVKDQNVGEWKQYSYNFTAQTNWVSIRATGNSSLYIDDVTIAKKGTIVAANEGNNYVNTDMRSVSPKTADTTTVAVLVSVIIGGAAIWVVLRKNIAEVIEKN